MKYLIIILISILPITVSAQLLRSYGVVEIGSTFPTSTVTGAKFAYRTVDSSFYRWTSGNTWVKIVEPSIVPDTLYLTESIGTSYKVSGDTINLTPYLIASDTTAMLVKYIERGDTTGMLSAYIRSAGWGLLKTSYTLTADSSKVATRYYAGTNFFPLEGGTLTGTGGAGFIGFPSQVSAPGTPASGLNVFAQGSSFNWKGTDGFERQFASTLTGGRTYTLPNVSGTFALGTGMTDQSVRWSGTNTLAAGNITDNGTRLIAGLPFQLKEYSLAGLPTGTTKDMYWITGAGPGWYQGARVAYAWESTASTFTTGSLIFAGSTGQAAQDNSNLFWDDTNNRLGIGTSSPASGYSLDVNGNGRFQGVAFRAGNNGFQVFNSGSGTADYTMLNSASSGNTVLSINSAGAGTTAAIFFKPNNATVGQFSASSTEFTIQHNSNVVRMLGGSGASPTEIRVATSGIGLSLAGTGATPSYILDIVGTNAVRFPRGTTAQTPTENAGILRWNTDTTAFQGYTGAARFYLADRTWVRSILTTSLGNYWSTAGNTSGSSKFIGTTDASPLNLRTNNRDRLVISSGGSISINTTSTTAKLNLVDTTSSSSIGLQSANYVTFTSNNAGSIFGSSNNINLRGAFTYNSSGGSTAGVDGSSYNGTIFHDGSGLAGTLINFRASIRTTSTGNVTNAIGFYTAVRNTSDTIANYYGMYWGGYDATTTGRVLNSYVLYGGDNGATTNHVNPWGVYIPNPAQKNLFGGLMTFSGYGTGTKEAADLSKTESVYTAWYATDGAVIEKRANTEQYNTITSTSSPQTLSSTIADNLINQGGTQATFTFQLPASPVDGQISKATFANAVTVLTIDGNGTTVLGTLPTTASISTVIIFKHYSGVGWVRQY